MSLIIALIVVGLILLLVEVVLLPGISFAGIVSFIAYGGTVYLAYEEYGEMGAFIVAAIILVISTIAIVLALRSKLWDQLALNQNIEGSIDKLPSEFGVKVGDKAETLTRLNPIGTVIINNKSYEAKSLNALIDQGVAVEVISIDDAQIVVKEQV